MNRFTRLSFLLLIALGILSCSRKKNTFINRKWHAMTTEYNTLYNGNLALEQGREELRTNYADNFWDVLPVERMAIDENITLPDSIRNKNFGVAEEKAVKAIQRHSMLIEGKERNPQIDEAYLLLGKARYFDQRFVPALDAFNYILHKYPASENINTAKVWREKTNIRLENEQLALKNLKEIINSEHIDEQNLADANAAIAQAYINLQQPDSALVPLQTAAEYTDKDEEKGRYYYIAGQLYNRLNRPAEANQAFDEVIELNRKSPRIYMVNAYVQKARNLSYEGGNTAQLREMLKDLSEDRENRPFLDKIYFQTGEFYRSLDSTKLAVEYYNKSLREPSSDKYLKSIDYEILADINFDQAKYRVASKYYDSTLVNMSPNLREFHSIKKKRENLDEVILYRELADKNDSILKLANMTGEDRIAYFTNYTNTLKEDFQKQIEEGNRKLALAQNAGPAIPLGETSASGSNSFYFYNPSRVTNGLRQFFITWGNRKLGDNWRWNDNQMNTGVAANTSEVTEVNFENDPRFDPMTYVSQIPTDNMVLDSLNRERNSAYYQLGLIYKEKFGEYRMAAERLEALLANSPEERLVLPAKYQLYETYGKLHEPQKQEQMRADILQNYSDSRYAAYIRDPQSRATEADSPETEYAGVYKKFEAQKYGEVISESNQYISRYTGDEIVPKFELLKAMAAGRLYGVDAYKSALNQVALTYPQSEEGKKAQDILNRAIPQLMNLEFSKDSTAGNFKLIYRFEKEDREEAEKLKATIEKAISDLDYRPFSVSLDVYDPEEIFVVVHGLPDGMSAQGFSELLQINKDYQVTKTGIPVSADNYRVIQIKKNLDAYLSSGETP